VASLLSEKIRDDDLVDMGLVLGRCRRFLDELLSVGSLPQEEQRRADIIFNENVSLRTDLLRLRLGLTRYWIEFYGVPGPYKAMHEKLRDCDICAPEEKQQMMRRIDEHVLQCRTVSSWGSRNRLPHHAPFDPLSDSTSDSTARGFSLESQNVTMKEVVGSQLTNEEIVEMRLALGRCRRFLDEHSRRTDLDAESIAGSKQLLRQYDTVMRRVSKLSASLAVELVERHEGRTEASDGLLQLASSAAHDGCSKEILSKTIDELVARCRALKQ